MVCIWCLNYNFISCASELASGKNDCNGSNLVYLCSLKRKINVQFKRTINVLNIDIMFAVEKRTGEKPLVST